MENEQVRKRGPNRTKDEIVADIDMRIQKHEQQIQEAEEKHKKTVAYHRACVEALSVKRDDALNAKTRLSSSAELLKKIKESGKTYEEIIALIDQWPSSVK